MSSVTNTCPSQCDDDPIPIVGILNLFVINFADVGERHSITIENAPASSINFASFSSLSDSRFVLPYNLNFFLN